MSQYPHRCCACNQPKRARNLVMLEQKALTPGKGWGCVRCGLANDGAVAAICDDCAELDTPEIQFVFDGYITDAKLVPIAELPKIPHQHDLTRHPEIER